MYVRTYIVKITLLLSFSPLSQNNKRDFIREVAKRGQNEAKKKCKKKRGKRGEGLALEKKNDY